MLLSGLITLVYAAAANAAANSDGLTVSTQQGDVIGTLVSPTVRQFLGIPYAVAGRWAAPSSPPIRTAPFTASNFSDSCFQTLKPSSIEFLKLAGLSDAISVPESEDCLAVNIWTPSVQRRQKTAVMIWVYGGSFMYGTSNTVAYNGQNIVRNNDDVLIVTFNYRLNIFGQPNAPQLVSTTKSQNFGLLDLNAVVQWVNNNIAAFGGDPTRITLFGQSAGAIAIDTYTYMHPQDTVVKGVIEQSGSLPGVIGTDATFDPAPWNTVAAAVGCGTTGDAAQLGCMKAVPARTLENAVISTKTTFVPMVDNITAPANYHVRANAGNFLNVPLLGGTTANEGDIFIVEREEVSLGFVLPVVTELLSDIMTLSINCVTSATGSDRVKAGVPTWRYQYQAIFPDISSRPDLRAYHSSEIPLVFGTYNKTLRPSPTSTEIVLGKYIQGAWVAFGRDPVHGLLNYSWPRYDPDAATLVQLGGSSHQDGASLGQPSLVDFTCNASTRSKMKTIQAEIASLIGIES